LLRSGRPTWRRPTGSRPERSQAELQRVFAAEQQRTDGPRVRKREQHSLRLKAVCLVVPLARHAPVRVEVAVLARDELAKAGEILLRRQTVDVVARFLGEPNELAKADQPERVQVLVRGRRRVGAARSEAVAAEKRAFV